MNQVRCELHCHSLYSPDSALSLLQVIEACRRNRLDVVALTDHDEIVGAQMLRAIAPDWLTVIVGEEISTRQGEVVGLFLSERIRPGLELGQAVHEIRRQGGLVLLPHPFDRVSGRAVGAAGCARLDGQVDAIEVFNARCLSEDDNRRAAEFARLHRLRAYVGSDAHTAAEYGNAVCSMPPFRDAGSFLSSLARARFSVRRADLQDLFRTDWIRQRKAAVRRA